jgi:hypothetical protein
MNGKSILFAWGRCALLIGGCFVAPAFCLIIAAEGRDGIPPFTLAALLLPILAIICLILSYRFARARPERALELANLAGIPPHALADFFADRLTPAEEDRLRNLAAEQVDSTQNSS